MKRIIIFVFIVILVSFGGYYLYVNYPIDEETSSLKVVLLDKEADSFKCIDENHKVYTFKYDFIKNNIYDVLEIKYTGDINNIEDETFKIKKIKKINGEAYKYIIPNEYDDDGLFKNYYINAYNKLNELTIDEKIGQLLLVRYSNKALNEIDKYKYSGFVFFKVDFKDKTVEQVQNMVSNAQKASNIPLITAVDEEGGTVSRLSGNYNLVKEDFKSPSVLYSAGGLNLIKKDTLNKIDVLSNLGLNLNLAPVVDIADPNNYIYNRTLKEDEKITSEFAKTVIEASKGSKVSFTLKHFPGYGNNKDTHSVTSVDEKTMEDLKNKDLLPFIAGIESGCEAILVSHNIVSAIDNINPSSISLNNHNLLRNDLKFTGVIITDDISMGAVSNIKNKNVLAVNAGNNLIITTDYKESFDEIKNALDNKLVSEDTINKLVFKVLAWKYYKGLMR